MKRDRLEIHHIDKKKKNNKFQNLRLMTKNEHKKTRKKQFGKKGRR